MNKIGLHLYLSNFQHESRIQKETQSLVESGLFDKIFIGALWEEGFKEHEILDPKREVWRVRLKTASLPESTLCKIFKYIEWMLKVFFRFRKEQVKFVNCHNLAALPIGMLFKLFRGTKVVYDAHELETERCGWGKARRALAKILERLLIYRTDLIFVVSESIGKWYVNRYKLNNLHVVYNYPRVDGQAPAGSPTILREKFGLRNDECLFIYQGVLGGGRYIDLILDVFSNIDKSKHIVFMGYGEWEDKVKAVVQKFPNMHFHPAVKPTEVLGYTRSADVGLSLIENTCLSYYTTLANKVVEYIVAGVPIITTNFPEPMKIINAYNCGWAVEAEKQVIIDLINSISKKDIEDKKNNALKCRHNFSWKAEENKLLDAYRSLGLK